MRLTTPFMALRNVTSDIWRMHDFNYQLPKIQVLHRYQELHGMGHGDSAKPPLKIPLKFNKQIGCFYTFFYNLHAIFRLLIFFSSLHL